MHTTFTTYLINTTCPKQMTETNCPLRDFMKKQHVFHQTINEVLFEPTKPYTEIRSEYIDTLDKIHDICQNCTKSNDQGR